MRKQRIHARGFSEPHKIPLFLSKIPTLANYPVGRSLDGSYAFKHKLVERAEENINE